MRNGIIGIVGLVVLALAGVAGAQLPDTTLVRSWRYTYEIPEGYTYNPTSSASKASIQDYGELGVVIIMRVVDVAGRSWYQAVWLDGDHVEVWKSKFLAISYCNP